ncbi:transcriptional regulator, partial [Mycobacterium sp. ITM-2017-0098]
ERHRERLVSALLRAGSADELRRAAEEASWTPSPTLTAVALPNRHHDRGGLITTDPQTLEVRDDAIELPNRMRMFLVSNV